jgi:hypothetical protein
MRLLVDLRHLKHRPAGWGAGIEGLLMQIEIAAKGLKFVEEAN